MVPSGGLSMSHSDHSDKSLGKLLPKKWQDFLMAQPETVSEGQTGDVVLTDGRIINDVVFLGGKYVSEVRGEEGIPFDPEDITEIRLTHKRWKFR